MATDKIIFLIGAAVCLTASLATMVMVLRETSLPLKPLWVILSLVGVGGAAMVWDMPDRRFWFLGIALPTVSFSTVEGGWQPELVRLLFPVGALISALRVGWHRRHEVNRSIVT